MPETPNTDITITEATRIQIMRAMGSKGGRAAGDKKKRPRAHYDRLAKQARARAKARRALDAS